MINCLSQLRSQTRNASMGPFFSHLQLSLPALVLPVSSRARLDCCCFISFLTVVSMGESGPCSFPIHSTTLFITNVLKKINYFICPNRRYTFISSERRELALFLFSSYFQFIGHYFEHKI